MKRFFLLLVMPFCAFFSSCEKTKSPQDLIVGTWLRTKTEINQKVGDVTNSKTILPDTDYFIELSNDGRGRFYSVDTNRDFTYDLDDLSDKLVLRFGNGGSTSYVVEELTKESLVLSSTGHLFFQGLEISGIQQEYYTRVK